MMTYVSREVIFLFLIGVTIAAEQAPEKKPESISTEPKSVPATWKTANGESIEIICAITFRLDGLNSDGTLAGNLVYRLAEDTRQKITNAGGKALIEIPVTLIINDVIAEFERDAKCPDLQIVINQMDKEVTGGRIHLNRLGLTIRESQQELSKLLCWIARPHMEKGRVLRRINRILSGEKKEEQ